MKKYFCEVCEQEVKIKLLPDYCSSHMWCDNCGCPVEFEDLSIPISLQLLIEYWGLLWDLDNTYKMHNEKIRLSDSCVKRLYENGGKCIKEELSKYYECYFNKDAYKDI
jgi:hypothetical protein